MDHDIKAFRAAAARPGGGGGSGGQQVSYGLTRVGGSSDGTGKTAWIIDTGIDLDTLIGVAEMAEKMLDKVLPSGVLRAGPRTRLA